MAFHPSSDSLEGEKIILDTVEESHSFTSPTSSQKNTCKELLKQEQDENKWHEECGNTQYNIKNQKKFRGKKNN